MYPRWGKRGRAGKPIETRKVRRAVFRAGKALHPWIMPFCDDRILRVRGRRCRCSACPPRAAMALEAGPRWNARVSGMSGCQHGPTTEDAVLPRGRLRSRSCSRHGKSSRGNRRTDVGARLCDLRGISERDKSQSEGPASPLRENRPLITKPSGIPMRHPRNRRQCPFSGDRGTAPPSRRVRYWQHTGCRAGSS